MFKIPAILSVVSTLLAGQLMLGLDPAAAEAMQPSTQPAVAETSIDIPDSQLRAALNRILGQAADAAISQEQMEELVRNVDLRSQGISNLEGLQYAVNVTGFLLADNDISDLSTLSSLTGLKRMGLERNRIVDLAPLASLVLLDYLNVAENQISDLSPLSSLRVMTALTADDNRISDLTGLGGLSSLGSLSLDRNQISDLSPLGTMGGLKYLHVDDNQISSLDPLQTIPDLWSVSADHNMITSIAALAKDFRLSRISVVGNAIADLSPLAVHPLLQVPDAGEQRVALTVVIREGTSTVSDSLDAVNIDGTLAALQPGSGYTVEGNVVTWSVAPGAKTLANVPFRGADGFDGTFIVHVVWKPLV